MNRCSLAAPLRPFPPERNARVLFTQLRAIDSELRGAGEAGRGAARCEIGHAVQFRFWQEPDPVCREPSAVAPSLSYLSKTSILPGPPFSALAHALLTEDFFLIASKLHTYILDARRLGHIPVERLSFVVSESPPLFRTKSTGGKRVGFNHVTSAGDGYHRPMCC